MSQCRERYIALLNNGPQGAAAHLLFRALWLCSLCYALVIVLRSFCYRQRWFRSYRAGVPVISVGNLTAGGTGKTPVVDALVKRLVKRGKKVAVVSRGYGGTFNGKFGRVSPVGGGAALSPEAAGDEPFLLASRNPEARVYIARKRRFGVAAAEADGVECIVLDDAFQHLAVQRDLDIVLLDARNPFGNGSLLPAGLLREPRRALRRADLLILTHSEAPEHSVFKEPDALRCRHRLADHLLNAEGLRLPWSHVAGRRCLAFAGIAHPTDFFAKLRSMGCDQLETLSFVDHQAYGDDELRRINEASVDVDFLLTTEKDAVKLQGAPFAKPCLTIPLELEFEHAEAIDNALERLFFTAVQ